MTTKAKATIEDLYNVSDNAKAEIVDGELVPTSPTGEMPARAGLRITMSLVGMEDRLRGRAYPDNVGYVVDLPNRLSFSPDASFHLGPPTGMKFLEGAPIFAVEIRSENDYRLSVEAAMARKRSDYFAAGTLVVWDVDLLSPDVIRSYDATTPTIPRVFRKDAIADAEPALPGWKFAVNELFS